MVIDGAANKKDEALAEGVEASSTSEASENSVSPVSPLQRTEYNASSSAGRKSKLDVRRTRGSSLLVLETKDDLLPGIVRHYAIPEHLSTLDGGTSKKSRAKWKSKLSTALKLHLANGHVFVAKRIKGYFEQSDRFL